MAFDQKLLSELVVLNDDSLGFFILLAHAAFKLSQLATEQCYFILIALDERSKNVHSQLLLQLCLKFRIFCLARVSNVIGIELIKSELVWVFIFLATTLSSLLLQRLCFRVLCAQFLVQFKN